MKKQHKHTRTEDGPSGRKIFPITKYKLAQMLKQIKPNLITEGAAAEHSKRPSYTKCGTSIKELTES